MQLIPFRYKKMKKIVPFDSWETNMKLYTGAAEERGGQWQITASVALLIRPLIQFHTRSEAPFFRCPFKAQYRGRRVCLEVQKGKFKQDKCENCCLCFGENVLVTQCLKEFESVMLFLNKKNNFKDLLFILFDGTNGGERYLQVCIWTQLPFVWILCWNLGTPKWKVLNANDSFSDTTIRHFLLTVATFRVVINMRPE